MGVDVFERLGPSAPQKASVFQRLGPVSGRIHKSQPKRGSVFQRLGPVSGRANVFERLGPRSSRKVEPKKSVFLRLGSSSSRVSDSRPKELVDYSWVYDCVEPVAEKEESPVCNTKILQNDEADLEKDEILQKDEAVLEKVEILQNDEAGCEISTNSCFSCVAQFEGHHNAVTGIGSIALPAQLNMIFSGSKDRNVRVWDWGSGNCVRTIDAGGEVGCMLCEGAWVFVGTTDSIKAWNTQANQEFSLSGVVGQVNAIVVAGNHVFAGFENGKILSWRFDATTNSFAAASSLLGHSSSVLSLAYGSNKLLYSGSADKTIRIWNVETTLCRQILMGHSGSVTSLVVVQHNILSCSLDGKIKVWAAASDGMFQVKDTHTTENGGFLSSCCVPDLEGKPLLLSSCNDNTVRAYEIPSFAERGKICSDQVVRCIQLGSSGTFLTGDAAGHVKVWKWSTLDPAISCGSKL